MGWWFGAVWAANPEPTEVTVDLLSGGLPDAVWNLQARWGEPVSLEMAPVAEGDLEADSGTFVARPNRLAFSYRGGLEEGLRAAVAAVDRDGGPGDYEVHRHGQVWHVVPTSRHAASGEAVPCAALTDLQVDLTSVNGTLTPTQAWSAVVVRMRESSGANIADAVADPILMVGVALGVPGAVSNEPVRLRHPRGTAAEVLDEIVAWVGPDWRWRVDAYRDGERTWVTVSPYRVEPADEARLNVAPIPPK